MNLPFLFIIATVAIDAMGIGLIFPVMPDLIQEVTGDTIGNAAVWGGILTTAFAVMQFLFGPFLGALSDRYGRRPVLLVALAVMAADYLVMAVAHTMTLLILGRIVAGITAATHSTAFAYMADISDAKQKGRNFGYLGAAFGLGFVLGPIIGGLIGQFGTRAPFYAAMALALLNLGLGTFVLRETVTDKIRRSFEWKRANPLGALLALNKLPGVGRGMAIFFLMELSFFVYPAVWAYFGHARFGWDAGMIGLSLGLYGVAMAAVQGGLVAPMHRLLGERGTMIFGLTFSIAAFAAISVVTSGFWILILTPLTALGDVAPPTLQGLLSRNAPDNQQGELQGGLTSLRAVATIIAPLVMTSVFAVFTAPDAAVFFPGAPFVLAMGLMAVALGLYLSFGRRSVA
ncbi:TCR/Tet family MFS transporter [Pseudoprimorskyibacter insulae]|uniref:Tetracycline resistance protein, class C n=1 Tax=Pseudoprimorskyibacter insulae TaxID=1695997 RepID=A0A2R8APD1_9RHOB|nr:TCR/Tet family MFS transporter [Pseudoprimorskyibacter insulae]SPF77926.1 Tetracycline resistance protein, class C [Pseudoprimorskyibacter insulae]